MVEYTLNTISLDSILGSLANPIRRDILRHISDHHLSVSKITMYYNVSLATISKHLKILEKASYRQKRGGFCL